MEPRGFPANLGQYSSSFPHHDSAGEAAVGLDHWVPDVDSRF